MIMDDILLSWPLEAPTLEPLQPLSFSLLDEQESSINVEKLSRQEIAGKLLDHLDQIADGQETDPFDWFANEKSIDIPIFENLQSPIPVGIQNNNNASIKPSQTSYYPYFDSPEYEPTFAPTNNAFGGPAIPDAPQPHLTYAPSFGAMSSAPPIDAAEVKKEVLTPPDSPKDEEILKMLEEIQPGDWERLVEFDERTTPVVADDISPPVSESSCPVDDLSDYASSGSPYLCSESNSDNDADYVPTRSVRRGSSHSTGGRIAGGGARRRASKPYSRPSNEERKLRKKEQNKNAATRYRMKKKQEVEESKYEEQLLKERNRELRNKLDDVSREVKCLKSLMRDVYRKKGLIK